MINDYSTLQSAVSRWLARADLALSIPDFITLAEARINLDLRTSSQQAQVSGTSSAGVIALPTSCKQVQSLIVTFGGVERELHPVPPEQAMNGQFTTVPDNYCVIGNNINIIANSDYAYRMVYFSGVPSLSDAAPQNWLITGYPQVYLYATLLEASGYLRDDARTALWGQGYANAVDALTRQSDSLRYSPTPRQRIDFCPP